MTPDPVSERLPDMPAPSGRVTGTRTALTVMTTIFFMWGFITAHNIAAFAAATGAVEFHASAKTRVSARMDQPIPALGEMDDAHWQTDAAEVRARVDALRTLSSSPQPPRRNPSQ
jgi:hypothetical protein